MENTMSTATTTLQIDLTGKRALVTGGTRGIGKGITDRLRAAGATVVVAARSAPRTPSLQVITADIATAAGSATIAERTLAILGGVDIVVHNVGGSQVRPEPARSRAARSSTRPLDDVWQRRRHHPHHLGATPPADAGCRTIRRRQSRPGQLQQSTIR